MKGKKIVIIVLLIVAVAIVAAAIATGFLAWRSERTSPADGATPVVASSSPATARTVDTSNWKTYTSTVFGFSFEYPPTWRSSGDLMSVVNPHIFFGNPLNGTTTYTLMVFIYNNPQNFSAADYVGAMLASDTAADVVSGAASGTAPRITPKFSRQFALTVGGLPAYELYSVFEFDHQGEQVYVQDGAHMIVFDFPIVDANPNIADPAANNATAHTIIDTLTFQ